MGLQFLDYAFLWTMSLANKGLSKKMHITFFFVDSTSRTMLAADQEELDEIEAFEHQTPLAKWGVRGAAFALVFALLFLWIWYR